MRNQLQSAILQSTKLAYQLARPLIFRQSAQDAHANILRLLASLDDKPLAQSFLSQLNKLAFRPMPTTVGGVSLPYPTMLAAGFIKGAGFDDEQSAQNAIDTGINIIPGWRTMPSLVGPVEFGSFTRWPRSGNSGTVIWRLEDTHSAQNRVGLKNPGAQAAASFLALHRDDLPEVYGINIASSPGVSDIQQQQDEVTQAIGAFLERDVVPSWFTLNISCPNTEDDPQNLQTEAETRLLCEAVINLLDSTSNNGAHPVPLWVKISPGLAESQYQTLIRVFHECGVGAVVACNTLAQPSPGNPALTAGLSGGELLPHTLRAVSILVHEKCEHSYNVDIIGCGGIHDPFTYLSYKQYGVNTVQYWTGMIYRGPLVAALILDEVIESHDE